MDGEKDTETDTETEIERVESGGERTRRRVPTTAEMRMASGMRNRSVCAV
jgi:hypothetical protein